MATKSFGGSPERRGGNVIVEFENGIAWVTMSRPEKKNAISLELAKEMVKVVDVLDQLQFADPERGRVQGMKQFLNEKSYRPDLGPSRRDTSSNAQANVPAAKPDSRR